MEGIIYSGGLLAYFVGGAFLAVDVGTLTLEAAEPTRAAVCRVAVVFEAACAPTGLVGRFY